MSLHRKREHAEFVEDCWGCKIGTVSVASIPGGTRPGAAKAEWEIKFKADQEAYREARRAGEAPPTSTVEGVRKGRIQQEVRERAQRKVESWIT